MEDLKSNGAEKPEQPFIHYSAYTCRGWDDLTFGEVTDADMIERMRERPYAVTVVINPNSGKEIILDSLRWIVRAIENDTFTKEESKAGAEIEYPEHIQKAADEIMLEAGVPGSVHRAKAEFDRICATLLALEMEVASI